MLLSFVFVNAAQPKDRSLSLVEPALPPLSIGRSPKLKRVALEFVSDRSVSILVRF